MNLKILINCRESNTAAAHLFPDENGALLVHSRLVVVVDVKLREQDLIFICS